ncbi:NAD-dependent epimerase/dehydratase family protein [Paenibacillus sp. GP183]|jgi:nucleoside-diphosphate-sugar epimerase|uniref:NAD-dependent epimerase/dehydratase family protein n=1 Tax=Paenibacillus sp. GP183 TaxID=1882751 RepID=UPI000894FA39|nr:NAD-dependent epimerase/dehydratase family protein [Paenibacillus sp. GP183]SEC69183.1 GDP-4-dehydro-6-deoxy-D-mannose reductase [Paenibacillus sp. GP183]
MDEKPMKRGTILITGAGGFTGRHACEQFSRSGYEIIAVVRTKPEVAPIGSLAVCDLTDPEQINHLIDLAKPDYVLHLSGRNSVPESWLNPVAYLEANMLATLYLLNALRPFPDCRIVIAGSMLNFPLSEDPRPPHPYSLSKTMQVFFTKSWQYLFDQQILIAQPSNLIGPGFSNGVCGLLARKIAALEKGMDASPFKLSSLVERRDYVDVRDAVAAYERVLFHGTPGKVYSIGTGATSSLEEMVNVYGTLTVCSLPIEIGQSAIPKQPHTVDMEPMRSLGWTPDIPFKQSLSDTLQFYRDQS